MGYQYSIFEDCFIDSFAGGGGASTGIEMATGHPVDVAINHNEAAIMMHKRNHPFTEHYIEDIWQVDPKTAVRGRHVKLAWFSPDCKHFSRAKGAALVDKKIRGLAWVVLKWAAAVRPDVIMLENVPEFTTWGPVRKGKPVKSKAGQTYKRWLSQLEALGYTVETNKICAADLGAPTIRTRFHLIARCDGKPIVWPDRTHAQRDSEDVKTGRCKPWRSAAEIIDFSLPCPSIFASKKEIKEQYGVTAMRPLKENTLRRITRGLEKFVIKSGEPFIVPVGYGEAKGQLPRVHDINNPLPTVVASNKNFVCDPMMTPYVICNNNGNVPHDMNEPVPTVTTGGRNILIASFLSEYYGNARDGINVKDPMQTITGKDRECVTLAHLAHFKGRDKGKNAKEPLMTVTARDGQFADVRTTIVKWNGQTDLGYWPEVRKMLNQFCGYNLADDEILLLKISGSWYFISDIGLRMMTPRELYDAMGFPHDYIIDRDVNGNPITRADQVARCGNAVCPDVAEALVRANLPEYCKNKIEDMAELHRVMVS
jgi:DNA (cytosine-5)-methyltransferase 1